MSEDEATPEVLNDEEAAQAGDEAPNERFRSWLRLTFAVLLGVLLVADMTLYAFYQAQASRTEAMDHRLERLSEKVLDVRAANRNAKKIEKIEQRVTGIENQVGELAKSVEMWEAKAPPPSPKKR